MFILIIKLGDIILQKYYGLGNVIVYQNGYQIGKIKSFVPGSEDVRLTLLCSAFFDVTIVNFTFIYTFTNYQYTITSVLSSSITFL